ncbi:MAG TPA: hypothetical protein VFM71_13780 [Gemmatimonadaceae bacterium]|nr:hypothetical protein [Gemmatimonadaceae bacterium]
MRITYVDEMSDPVRGPHVRQKDALDDCWRGMAAEERRKKREAAATREPTDAELDRMLHALGARGRKARRAAAKRGRVARVWRGLRVFVGGAVAIAGCVVVWTGLRLAGWR